MSNSTTPQAKSGHPNGLMTLFFSEMWERFCYYGMRVLLTLYLVKSLMKGDAEASLIYGAYTGLVYAAPILGGRMADQFLGYRWAVMLGAILMAIGEFMILGGNDFWLLLGMGVIIVGNGYFKANISTIVGKLYEDGDPRRDSGFTIFYIGINIGALLATTVVAFVGETYGFKYGFGLAGIGMLLGLLIFWSGRKSYSAADGLEVTESGKKSFLGPLNYAHAITLGSLLLVPVFYFLIVNNSVLNIIFFILFLVISFSLIKSGINTDKKENTKIWRDRMISLIIFMVINVVFWACFEQAGTSLTLFADRNVDREIAGWIMPASMTQFFNPFFIITFGSLFSWMWVKLSNIGKNPNIPLKFAFGILQLGFGFLITYLGYQFAEENLVPLLTLVFLYMLHTTGELFLSPIGLSMVTKLSPKHMAATAMGAWFLSFAIANLLGGQIAALTGSGHGSGGDEVEGFSTKTTVEEAFIETNNEAAFEEWPAFYLVPEDLPIKAKEKKNIEIPKNITYAKFLGIYDWVYFRESIDQGYTLEEWQKGRPEADVISSYADWLENEELWSDLKNRYKELVERDVRAAEEQKGLSMSDWSYYNEDLENLDIAANTELEMAIEVQIDKVQKNRLDKYVHIFSIIGLVLLGISVLIMLVNKPLERLMHGVK
jgi:POT family proton-dependent oligopeptide transporter